MKAYFNNYVAGSGRFLTNNAFGLRRGKGGGKKDKDDSWFDMDKLKWLGLVLLGMAASRGRGGGGGDDGSASASINVLTFYNGVVTLNQRLEENDPDVSDILSAYQDFRTKFDQHLKGSETRLAVRVERALDQIESLLTERGVDVNGEPVPASDDAGNGSSEGARKERPTMAARPDNLSLNRRRRRRRRPRPQREPTAEESAETRIASQDELRAMKTPPRPAPAARETETVAALPEAPEQAEPSFSEEIERSADRDDVTTQPRRRKRVRDAGTHLVVAPDGTPAPPRLGWWQRFRLRIAGWKRTTDDFTRAISQQSRAVDQLTEDIAALEKRGSDVGVTFPSLRKEAEALRDQLQGLRDDILEHKRKINEGLKKLEAARGKGGQDLESYFALFDRRQEELKNRLNQRRREQEELIKELRGLSAQHIGDHRNQLQGAADSIQSAIESAGAAQVGAINSAGSERMGELEEAAGRYETAIRERGDHKLREIRDEGDGKLGAIDSASEQGLGAIEAKRDEIIRIGDDKVGVVQSKTADAETAINNLLETAIGTFTGEVDRNTRVYRERHEEWTSRRDAQLQEHEDQYKSMVSRLTSASESLSALIEQGTTQFNASIQGLQEDFSKYKGELESLHQAAINDIGEAQSSAEHAIDGVRVEKQAEIRKFGEAELLRFQGDVKSVVETANAELGRTTDLANKTRESLNSEISTWREDATQQLETTRNATRDERERIEKKITDWSKDAAEVDQLFQQAVAEESEQLETILKKMETEKNAIRSELESSAKLMAHAAFMEEAQKVAQQVRADQVKLFVTQLTEAQRQFDEHVTRVTGKLQEGMQRYYAQFQKYELWTKSMIDRVQWIDGRLGAIEKEVLRSEARATNVVNALRVSRDSVAHVTAELHRIFTDLYRIREAAKQGEIARPQIAPSLSKEQKDQLVDEELPKMAAAGQDQATAAGSIGGERVSKPRDPKIERLANLVAGNKGVEDAEPKRAKLPTPPEGFQQDGLQEAPHVSIPPMPEINAPNPAEGDFVITTEAGVREGLGELPPPPPLPQRLQSGTVGYGDGKQLAERLAQANLAQHAGQSQPPPHAPPRTVGFNLMQVRALSRGHLGRAAAHSDVNGFAHFFDDLVSTLGSIGKVQRPFVHVAAMLYGTPRGEAPKTGMIEKVKNVITNKIPPDNFSEVLDMAHNIERMLGEDLPTGTVGGAFVFVWARDIVMNAGKKGKALDLEDLIAMEEGDQTFNVGASDDPNALFGKILFFENMHEALGDPQKIASELGANDALADSLDEEFLDDVRLELAFRARFAAEAILEDAANLTRLVEQKHEEVARRIDPNKNPNGFRDATTNITTESMDHILQDHIARAIEAGAIYDDGGDDSADEPVDPSAQSSIPVTDSIVQKDYIDEAAGMPVDVGGFTNIIRERAGEDAVNNELWNRDFKLYQRHFHAYVKLALEAGDLFNTSPTKIPPMSSLLKGLAVLIMDVTEFKRVKIDDFAKLINNNIPKTVKKITAKRLNAIIGKGGAWRRPGTSRGEHPKPSEIQTLAEAFTMFSDMARGSTKQEIADEIRAATYMIWAVDGIQRELSKEKREVREELRRVETRDSIHDQLSERVGRLFDIKSKAWQDAIWRLGNAAGLDKMKAPPRRKKGGSKPPATPAAAPSSPPPTPSTPPPIPTKGKSAASFDLERRAFIQARMREAFAGKYDPSDIRSIAPTGGMVSGGAHMLGAKPVQTPTAAVGQGALITAGFTPVI